MQTNRFGIFIQESKKFYKLPGDKFTIYTEINKKKFSLAIFMHFCELNIINKITLELRSFTIC